LRAQYGDRPVAGHAPRPDQLVGLATRAHTGLTDVLIESHGWRVSRMAGLKKCGSRNVR
jgi:hypothetical protein